MSHVDDIQMEITDLEALEAAAKELGCVYVKGKTRYKWFGRHVGDHPLPAGFTPDMLGKCEHVIQLPGCEYEIGVVKVPGKTGVYTLLFDFWGPGRKLQDKFGRTMEKFKQFYGLNAAERLARAKGKTTIRKKVNGGIKLQIAIGK